MLLKEIFGFWPIFEFSSHHGASRQCVIATIIMCHLSADSKVMESEASSETSENVSQNQFFLPRLITHSVLSQEQNQSLL